MSDQDDQNDAPPSRTELEHAIRHLSVTLEDARDLVLQLAAQVVALQEQLADRGVIDADAVSDAIPALVDGIRLVDARSGRLRLELADGFPDKYTTVSPDIPCLELLPLCRARCCTFYFCLSSQDLEEGVVRWDLGQPYRNRRHAGGACTHLDTESYACEVYEHRPAPCRAFDCRGDSRIWTDFERRIPAPLTDDTEVDEPMTPEIAARAAAEARGELKEWRAALTVEELVLKRHRDD